MQRPILVSFNESIPERPVRYTPREQEILDEARERAYQTNAKASIERCHKRALMHISAFIASAIGYTIVACALMVAGPMQVTNFGAFILGLFAGSVVVNYICCWKHCADADSISERLSEHTPL